MHNLYYICFDPYNHIQKSLLAPLPGREIWVPDPPGDDDGLLLWDDDTIIDEWKRRAPDAPRSTFDDVLFRELVRLTPLGDVLRLMLSLLIIELFLARSAPSAPLGDWLLVFRLWPRNEERFPIRLLTDVNRFLPPRLIVVWDSSIVVSLSTVCLLSNNSITWRWFNPCTFYKTHSKYYCSHITCMYICHARLIHAWVFIE